MCFKFSCLNTYNVGQACTMYPLEVGNIMRDKMSKLHSKFRIQFYILIILLTIISTATGFVVTSKWPCYTLQPPEQRQHGPALAPLPRPGGRRGHGHLGHVPLPGQVSRHIYTISTYSIYNIYNCQRAAQPHGHQRAEGEGESPGPQPQPGAGQHLLCQPGNTR